MKKVLILFFLFFAFVNLSSAQLLEIFEHDVLYTYNFKYYSKSSIMDDSIFYISNSESLIKKYANGDCYNKLIFQYENSFTVEKYCSVYLGRSLYSDILKIMPLYMFNKSFLAVKINDKHIIFFEYFRILKENDDFIVFFKHPR